MCKLKVIPWITIWTLTGVILAKIDTPKPMLYVAGGLVTILLLLLSGKEGKDE